jgi:UPF0176 protein
MWFKIRPCRHHTYLTAAFYKFVDLPDYQARRAPLLALCEARNVKGLILLAREGINSTIAGAASDVYAVLDYLRADPLLADLQHKESFSQRAPFYRMKVRLKKEIVTLGVDGISPTHMAGTYVKPADWNALISDPDVVLVDTRNDYEVAIGTFAGAIDPHIQSFSQLPELGGPLQNAWARPAARNPKWPCFAPAAFAARSPPHSCVPKVMTRSTTWKAVFLKYLETVPPEQSLWQGECFVFDERVSVGHGLVPGHHALCRACRQPLEDGATQSPLFELGVSCPRCHALTSEAQKNSARERQRQWELAKARQQDHIGAKLPKPVTAAP